MGTTQEEIRDRFNAGELLNDGAPRNVDTDSPDNDADTVVAEDSDIHVVNPDGTNTVDLSNVEEEGRAVTVVHNGGESTPTVEFDDADFVETGPEDITSTGATATIANVDGTASGWVVLATGSA